MIRSGHLTGGGDPQCTASPFAGGLAPQQRSRGSQYTVFNVDQCDNLPDSVKTGKPLRVRNPDTRDQLADDFLHSTGADIREGHGEAYFVPSHDFISLPAFEAFKGADHFYNVAFHELTHWTGHKSRLDRDLKNRFAATLTVPERLLLFCLASDTDWQATPRQSRPTIPAARANACVGLGAQFPRKELSCRLGHDVAAADVDAGGREGAVRLLGGGAGRDCDAGL
jgi:hypothetical protein